MEYNRLYTYKCPTCEKEFTYNEPAEPLCDGPGAVSSHPPKVMRRIRVKDRDQTKEVSPEEGRVRAQGTLLTPEALVSMRAQVHGKRWVPKDGINPWTGDEMDSDSDSDFLTPDVHDTGMDNTTDGITVKKDDDDA